MKHSSAPLSPNLVFTKAAEDWLKVHSRYISSRTVSGYREHLKPLGVFFGKYQLKKITIQMIREYQQWRRLPHKELDGPEKFGPRCKSRGAGNAKINGELNTVSQILKEAGLWSALSDFYSPLPIDRQGSGHALSAEDEKTFLEIAFSLPRATTFAHCLRIMFKCGVGFGELKHLRRQDVDLDNARFIVQMGAKNIYRQRTVPLIPEALESMKYLIERWTRLGGTLPEQYIIAARKHRWGGNRYLEQKGYFDFSKPMVRNEKIWQRIKAAALPVLGDKIKNFRCYDARVTAITRALSDGNVPLHAAQRVFGHVNADMSRRYFKPEENTMRKVLEVLATDQRPPAHSNPVAAAVYSVAAKADSAMGISITALMESLERAGLSAEKILQVIKDTLGKTA